MTDVSPKRIIRILLALFGLLSVAIIINGAYLFSVLNLQLEEKITDDLHSKLSLVTILHQNQIEEIGILSNIAREQTQKYCDFLDFDNVAALTSMVNTMANIYAIDILLLYDETDRIVTSYPGGSTFADPGSYQQLLNIDPQWSGVVTIDSALIAEQYPDVEIDSSTATVLAFHSSVELIHDTGGVAGRIILLRLIAGNEPLIELLSNFSATNVVYYDASGQSLLSSFGDNPYFPPQSRSTEVNGQDFYISSKPLLNDNGEIIAYLAVALEEEPFHQQRSTILAGSLTPMLLTILILGFTVYLLNSRVFSKVSQLSRTLRKVTVGSNDFSIRTPIAPGVDNQPGDEVDAMITDFNQMMAKLEDTHQQMMSARQEVENSNRQLEQRVHERTRELENQVSAKEKALAELAEAQSSLLEMSRSAGMAEVATGVLHNVGNVLNSVNMSCSLLMEQLRESRAVNLAKVAEMLSAPEGGLAHFLCDDPRGKKIPAYLDSLAHALGKEHQLMLREANSLRERVEHIKEIVSMQQTYGRISGVVETLSAEQLMEDALKLNAETLNRNDIRVEREYEPVPLISTEKHKVLQILLNLMTNATYACLDSDEKKKRVVLRINSVTPGKICFAVEDNGMGIAAENLTCIFQHGFTTRKTGHGFGLHSGALAARDLNGSLTGHSDGPGRGAIFCLELPCNSGKKR
jgi:signal transduction histidine kinase